MIGWQEWEENNYPTPLHHWLMRKLTQLDRGNLVTFVKHLNTDPL